MNSRMIAFLTAIAGTAWIACQQTVSASVGMQDEAMMENMVFIFAGILIMAMIAIIHQSMNHSSLTVVDNAWRWLLHMDTDSDLMPRHERAPLMVGMLHHGVPHFLPNHTAPAGKAKPKNTMPQDKRPSPTRGQVGNRHH